MHQSIKKREYPPALFSHGQILASRAGKFCKITPPPGAKKLGQKLKPWGKFFTCFNTVIVIRQPKGCLLIWSGGGKNMNFYVKSPIRSLLTGRFRQEHARKNIPLFGINQMLVSSTGGKGSLPS